MIPFIVGCALFMQMLDATVVATALPAMALNFGTTVVHMNVTITSYLLATAVFVPISGWAADRFGARAVFLAAIALFTLSSVACAASVTLAQLVAARLVQGAAGAMMVPVGRIILLRRIPKAELLKAMAFLTIPALLGPVIGPPVGGFLVTYASWHWIFLINIPVGILGIYMVRRWIAADVPDSRPRLDTVGFLLSSAAMAALMSCLEAAGHGSLGLWPTLGLLGLGLVCGILYIRHARHVTYPIIDLSLLRIQTFAVSVLGGNLCRFSVGASPFLLAILLQVGFGLSAFSAGMITFTSAAGAMLMKLVATPIVRRFGFRRVLVANALIAAAFIAACALFRADTPIWAMVAVLLVGGFFRSLQFTAINALTYADLDSAQMSRASSFAATAQQLGISLGVACAAMTLNLSMTLRGGVEADRIDVMWGFAVIALIVAASALSFRRLPARAGSQLRARS
ncbi:EmrB/QacA subfamily drug resistance transporter [Castellaniella defragrans]|jgi:EmrB/QacA subfamily drug resistance transporter|uniref:EmrB/QacA subfamily drug resistance transporter n=2 Tax=Castellaniella defragrans TaxID=75697 RepID=A0A7W9WN67_CASDE|nr:DHA2 family efflux MFS transporter permease subunit [Castellaniella defragrans]KAB0600700.1 DHA2 family efflux MFS transporter permease subunit [Castellaniella defragrans]MBB6083436.1 EmrB/QacA subfamily drug resistance transporter [Castellaniella defragrans]